MSSSETEVRGGWPEFYQFVLQTPSLHEELLAADDEQSLIKLVVDAGRRHGFTFAEARVIESLRNARGAWIQRWID